LFRPALFLYTWFDHSNKSLYKKQPLIIIAEMESEVRTYGIVP